MSLFKLAIYGGIGYLVYQTFFSDNPGGSSPFGSSRDRGSSQHSGRQSFGQSRQGGRSGSRGRNSAGQFTGGGTGAVERTEEPSGTSVTHHVGRGVI